MFQPNRPWTQFLFLLHFGSFLSAAMLIWCNPFCQDPSTLWKALWQYFILGNISYWKTLGTSRLLCHQNCKSNNGFNKNPNINHFHYYQNRTKIMTKVIIEAQLIYTPPFCLFSLFIFFWRVGKSTVVALRLSNFECSDSLDVHLSNILPLWRNPEDGFALRRFPPVASPFLQQHSDLAVLGVRIFAIRTSATPYFVSFATSFLCLLPRHI